MQVKWSLYEKTHEKSKAITKGTFSTTEELSKSGIKAAARNDLDKKCKIFVAIREIVQAESAGNFHVLYVLTIRDRANNKVLLSYENDTEISGEKSINELAEKVTIFSNEWINVHLSCSIDL